MADFGAPGPCPGAPGTPQDPALGPQGPHRTPPWAQGPPQGPWTRDDLPNLPLPPSNETRSLKIDAPRPEKLSPIRKGCLEKSCLRKGPLKSIHLFFQNLLRKGCLGFCSKQPFRSPISLYPTLRGASPGPFWAFSGSPREGCLENPLKPRFFGGHRIKRCGRPKNHRGCV